MLHQTVQSLVLVTGLACPGLTQESPVQEGVTAEPEAQEAFVLQDAELTENQRELLAFAFDAASSMPHYLHIRNRSRAQEVVLRTALELEAPGLALDWAPGVDNWLRADLMLDVAYHYLQQGAEAQSQQAAEWAEDYVRESGDESLAEWRLDQVQAKFERLAQYDPESGSLEATLEWVQAVAELGEFDGVQAAMASCVELYERYGDDEDARTAIFEAMEGGWTGIPLQERLNRTADLVRSATARGDRATALRFLGEYKQVMDGFQWIPRDGIPIRAVLASLRHQAGLQAEGLELAEEAAQLYRESEPRMVDIFRADALAPLAVAYAEMGLAERSRALFGEALEAAGLNPNSRPRVDDLVLVATAMARVDLEPTEEQWELLRAMTSELGDPW